MGESLKCFRWTLQKAAQTSLLFVPLLCTAAGREDTPPRIAGPVSEGSELGETLEVTDAPLLARQLTELKLLNDASAGGEATESAKVDNNAVVAALADGVTTKLALAAGGIEGNALAAGFPLGLAALTGAKVLIAKLAENLPEENKRTVIKTASAAWGGAALNNMLVALAVAPPLSIIAGIVTGIIVWHHTANQYKNQDRLAALEKEKRQRLAVLNNETPASTVPVQANLEGGQVANSAAAY